MLSCHWVTIKEFAAIAKVDQSTVRRWIKQGRLPHVKIDRTTRVCEYALDRLETSSVNGK